MSRIGRPVLASVLAAFAAGGCVQERAPGEPGQPTRLADPDKTVQYSGLGHVSTEARNGGLYKLYFGGHVMTFEPGRVELDDTDLWARHYRDVVLRRGRGGELQLTVDGNTVPTHVELD